MKFLPTEKPKWRKSGVIITTSQMISEIASLRKKYCSLSDGEKSICSKVVPIMAVDSIYHLNVREKVGTQSWAETKDIIQSVDQLEGTSDARAIKETLNTHSAMEKLFDLFKVDFNNEGLLSVQEICGVHGILMEGLHPKAGRIREDNDIAITCWDDDVHIYPIPKKAEDQFYGLVDCYNIVVSNLLKTQKKGVEKHHTCCCFSIACDQSSNSSFTEAVIKCSTLLMANFVNAHPFADGNGRMCRLLANYALGLITPFPVTIYHTDTAGNGVGRDDYVNAIVQFRVNPDEGPRDTAAMLTEGLWRGWKIVFKYLESYKSQMASIGPLVLQLDGAADAILRKVERILRTNSHLTMEKEVLVETIKGALKQNDYANLEQNECKRVFITLKEGLKLELNVYK